MTQTKTLRSDALGFANATGDLACRQIFPALQVLIRRGHFEMPIIGVAKSTMSRDALRERAHETLEQHGRSVRFTSWTAAFRLEEPALIVRMRTWSAHAMSQFTRGVRS